jgi:serine/threonine-protein kinase RsbW
LVSGLILSDATGKLAAMRVSYSLDSTLESVNQAEIAATQVAAQAGFNEDEVCHIAMAVREAAVNAVLHGNAYDSAKKVEIGFEHSDRKLIVTVRDQGKGLDANSLPNPLAPANLMKESGRGIFLMRAFMDEVHIRKVAPGTEITLVKHLQDNSADGKEKG